MAHVEHALGAALLTGEHDTTIARNQFDGLRTLAWRPVDSPALLRDLAAAM